MSLSRTTLRALAEMICGAHGTSSNGFNWPNFPYRSSGKLTQFFCEDCRLPYKHEVGTRVTWVIEVLQEIDPEQLENLGHPSPKVVRVIQELLESVRVQSPDKHQGAIHDVNRILSRDELQVQYFSGKYRLLKNNEPKPLVELTELDKCIVDFIDYISAEMRMSFWRVNSNTKQREWVSYPEQHAKQLLRTYLNGRFKGAISVFEEINAGAGRIDLFIESSLGEKLIIELKMCGHNYSESYAREGVEQIAHYMDNKKTETGYLVIFDSRVRDFSKGFQAAEEFGRKTVLTKIADVRPYVKTTDAPAGV